ncbi:chemotaxis protein CheB [Tateyamaria sp. SN3-11]|uniref:chemotaxis protein CheB n=1 Tax=Tateyamaria sp. SN3-11 TaxID=3092147 RepID=UPI0039ECC0B3
MVVDDSITMRRWLSSVIAKDKRLDLVGMAGSAQEAREVIKATNPDVLTLDVEMPGMNGLEFLAHLMRLRPMPVVMLAASISSDSLYARHAMEIGAACCVAKPSLPTPDAMQALCDTIVAAASGENVAGAKEEEKSSSFYGKILLIGASTGGVAAIETVLKQMPADCPPIVIAQHMPQSFLESFVKRLDRQGPHNVGFSSNGLRLSTGDIRLAPSRDSQTCVTWHSNAWHIQDVPRRYDHAFCPSVDVLFASATPWARQVGALLLTGLGSDGAKGMLALRQNGGRTIGQSESSCVVYGMPGAALAMNASEEEADIDQIGKIALSRMAEPTIGQVAG